MPKLSWRQAATWRVRRHHLHRREPSGTLLSVARRLCGLHAQVMSSAELSVWARVEALDRRAIQRALWEERTLVKTWAMRGTLHLLPAADLPLWHAALAVSRRYRRPALWQKLLGITLEEVDRLTEAIGSALEGRLMTREELVAEVRRLTRSAAFGQDFALNGWGTMLKPAAFAGRLCFAPGIGQRVRFTNPNTWLAAAPTPLDPETAGLSMARSYLAAYGPASLHDFARWWGDGGVSSPRQWIAALGEEVTSVDLEGTPAWMLAAHLGEARDAPPCRSVRLLPAFDQYVVAASRHAHHLLPGNFRHKVYRPQGWISPVLLVNGRMEGTWRHQLKGSRVEVAIEPFGNAPAWVRRAAEDEGGRLAAFLGGALHLTWKT